MVNEINRFSIHWDRHDERNPKSQVWVEVNDSLYTFDNLDLGIRGVLNKLQLDIFQCSTCKTFKIVKTHMGKARVIGGPGASHWCQKCNEWVISKPCFL